ncbi:MAG: transcriptional repressor [Campylobacterota bacterium]|nr:transcriptional repressor [Campylobacterota bacterium]
MIYISPKQRKSLSVFRESLYKHLKEHDLRYSDQREQVLKILYKQSCPTTIDKLVLILSSEYRKSASYPTVARHVNFFREMGWLQVANKSHKEYILVKVPPNYEENIYEMDDYDPL